MRILIADDCRVLRRLLAGLLSDWGHEVVIACDGDEAWRALQNHDAPKLAILDWEMPGIPGIELGRKVRAIATPEPPHLILLTGREATKDVVAGIESGANDYVTKPFDQDELRARVRVGAQIVELQASLAPAWPNSRTRSPRSGDSRR